MQLPCLQNIFKGTCILAISLALLRTCCHGEESEDVNIETSQENERNAGSIASSVDSKQNLVLVSTLDGKIAALDAKNGGKVLWTEETGPGPLLSSTISNIKITYDGQPIRLVPSLKGGLYKFDGEIVEPLPVTAESLLSSSFKLSDRSIISGGNEIRTYGINAKTGKVNYVCEMSKCVKMNKEDKSMNDRTLIIERRTQTVRSIDPWTGNEKWNFSVGRNEASVATSSCPLPTQFKGADDDDISVMNLNPNCRSSSNSPPQDDSDFFIKFIIPDGVVCAVDKYNPNHVVWKKKFNSPVVSAWEMKNDDIHNIDLFDSKAIPALNPDQKNDESIRRPFMYIGLYNKQLYIQESSLKSEEINLGITDLSFPSPSKSQLKLPWKPYSAAASFKTLLKNSKEKAQKLLNEPSEETAVVVRHDSCNRDCGYYLYSDATPVPSSNKKVVIHDNTTFYQESIDHIVIMSLWHWWREVLAISIVSSVMMHLLITRHALKKMKARLLRESSNSNQSVQSNASEPQIFKEEPKPEEVNEKLDNSTEYKSRYTTDFDMIQCLGKGGFGVVFEAKNVIDDCHYAVKRICLPNRENAREKVMREVKALAKLDHLGIVRYFNAWLECPPPGWQDQQDSYIFDNDVLTPTPCETTKNAMKANSTNENNNKVSNFSTSKDETGSFNCDDINKVNSNDFKIVKDTSASFDVVFEHSQELTENSTDVEKPFKKYSSGIVDDVSDSISTDMSVSNNNLPNQEIVNTQTNSITFEYDSGCDESEKLPVKVDVEQELSQEIRPQSLSLKYQNKKLFLYIQMQLCKKETLKDWMNENNKPRDKMEILDIYEQILSAVQYVHEQGLMHRDLKPSNIFFSMDGLVKIGDFGLVTAMTENQADLIHTPLQEKNFDQHHTDQVGTQLYMSPEQIARQPYNHKVDIFSLGLILFELLVPFSTAMERVKVMSDIKAQKFPPEFIKNQTDECNLLQKILSPSPENRPEASEIKSDLYNMNSELQLKVRKHVRSSSRTFSTSSNDSL